MLLKIAAVTTGVFALRYRWWRMPISKHYPRILMYHMISNPLPDSKGSKWCVAPQDFAKQMQYLHDHGWQAFTMSELMQHDKMPPKSLAITFDDGFANVYEHAMPILQSLGLKSTHYLLSKSQTNDWDAEKGIPSEALLSVQQVKTMLATGLVEIGVHGQQHRSLTTMTADRVVEELSQAKEALETRYGVTCRSLAYPFGCWNEDVLEMAQECGFDHAVAVANAVYRPGQDHCFAIPRLTMDGRRSGLLDFASKLSRG